MFDKEFLKTLTVLYVEDDETIRKSLGNILNKIFKEVVICIDGGDGLSTYQKYTQDMDIRFDVIISDINMPNLNGLDMIKEIKKIDADIPAIVTTAHGEANYLLEAIKIGVSGYTLKPIDTKELLMTVQKFCEIKRNQKIIAETEEQLSEYMSFINSMSTIVKLDDKECITEANEFFCAMMEQEEEQLIGLNIVSLLHPDSIANHFKDLRASIRSGETWRGKLKFISSIGENFVLRSSNIPIKNIDTDHIDGYISIGYLADEEEAEKKQTISKAKTNLLEQKHKVLNLNKQVKTLKTKSKQLDSTTYEAEHAIKLLKEALFKERQKTSDLHIQINHYEDDIKMLRERLDTVADLEHAKRTDSLKRLNDLQKEYAALQDKLIAAQSQINKLTPKSEFIE